MTTKILTSDFIRDYGIIGGGVCSLSASTEYLIMGSYSDSVDWFIMGAASNKGALNMLLEAMKYYTSLKSGVYMFKDDLLRIHYIKSAKSDKHIMVYVAQLCDGDFSIGDGGLVTIPSDTMSVAAGVIDKFSRQESI